MKRNCETVQIKDALLRYHQSVEDKARGENVVKTGYGELDSILGGGLERGKLLCIAARPGMGKSLFTINLLSNVSREKAVCIFSGENTVETVTGMLLAKEGMIDLSSMRSRTFTAEEWEKLAAATESLSKREVYIDNTCAEKGIEIEEKIKNIKNLGLVVVDYACRFAKTGKRNRWQHRFLTEMKILAEKYNVPVVLTMPVGRSAERRSSCRPTLADLHGMNAAETFFDVVMFLYRDCYYSFCNEVDENVAQIIVSKNTGGPLGEVPLEWQGRYGTFSNLEEDPDVSYIRMRTP